MNVDLRSCTKAGRLPSSVRTFVQRTLRSGPVGSSSMSTKIGMSFWMWMMTPLITVEGCPTTGQSDNGT